MFSPRTRIYANFFTQPNLMRLHRYFTLLKRRTQKQARYNKEGEAGKSLTSFCLLVFCWPFREPEMFLSCTGCHVAIGSPICEFGSPNRKRSDLTLSTVSDQPQSGSGRRILTNYGQTIPLVSSVFAFTILYNTGRSTVKCSGTGKP